MEAQAGLGPVGCIGPGSIWRVTQHCTLLRKPGCCNCAQARKSVLCMPVLRSRVKIATMPGLPEEGIVVQIPELMYKRGDDVSTRGS